MRNESGITPVGRRVLVKPDVIEETTEGGILLPGQDLERHQQAISTGYLIAVGEDAFIHGVEEVYRIVDGQMRLVERRIDRRMAPYAKEGDRVVFAKFGGKEIPGADGQEYRLLNDEDITALADESVQFGGFGDARMPLSKQA